MQDDRLVFWTRADARYERNDRRGDGERDEVRLVGNTDAAVLFTAPHAVKQIRAGTMKPSDARTGGLAEVLASTHDGAALTTAGPLTGDPNRDDDPEMPFKRELGALLREDRVVLDLHGMSNRWGPDVCLGRGPCQGDGIEDLVEILTAGFESAGLKVAIDWPYPAQGRGTVASFVQRAGYRALQLELAARLRDPKRFPSRAIRLLQGFDRALAALEVPR